MKSKSWNKCWIESWISRLAAPLVAFALTVVPPITPAHAVEDAGKVSVVSFGLFGDQGVFKSEATGAAQVVASRFGNGRWKWSRPCPRL